MDNNLSMIRHYIIEMRKTHSSITKTCSFKITILSQALLQGKQKLKLMVWDSLNSKMKMARLRINLFGLGSEILPLGN